MGRLLFILMSFVLLPATAQAQTAVSQLQPQLQSRFGAVEQASPSSALGRPEVRVQVNMNLFVPGAFGLSDELLKAQEQARRVLYESAARECELLKSILATECRLETLSVNINRSYGQPQREGFTVSGNFGYKVTLK